MHLDGLVRLRPGKALLGGLLYHLEHVLGRSLFLERMGVVPGGTHHAVDRAHDESQLAAFGPASVKALAGPQPPLAAVPVDLVQLIRAVGMALGVKEHRRAEHGVGQRHLLAKQAFDEAELAALSIVFGQLQVYAAGHVAHVLIVVLGKARLCDPVCRKLVDGGKERLFRTRCERCAGCGLAFSRSRALRGALRCRGGVLRALERGEGAVEGNDLVVAQKLGGQVVIDGVIEQPGARVAVELRSENSIGLPERFDLAVAGERVCDADSAEQLV